MAQGPAERRPVLLGSPEAFSTPEHQQQVQDVQLDIELVVEAQILIDGCPKLHAPVPGSIFACRRNLTTMRILVVMVFAAMG